MVSIMIGSDLGRTPVGSVTANGGGAFAVTISVPEDVDDGFYSLWAVGDQGTEASTPITVGEIKPEVVGDQ
jgi:hypothetical protein